MNGVQTNGCESHCTINSSFKQCGDMLSWPDIRFYNFVGVLSRNDLKRTISKHANTDLITLSGVVSAELTKALLWVWLSDELFSTVYMTRSRNFPNSSAHSAGDMDQPGKVLFKMAFWQKLPPLVLWAQKFLGAHASKFGTLEYLRKN